MTARIFNGSRRVDAIAADDRGVAYGDGLFETMRVHRGTVPWWDAHWARLRHGAQRLRLRLPEPRQVREEAADLFASDDPGAGAEIHARAAAVCGGNLGAADQDVEIQVPIAV